MFWAVALATILLDQLTKAVVRSRIPVGAIEPLIPGVLDLTHVRNMGAAFGLMPGRQPIFIATSVVVLVAIVAYWRRDRPTAVPVVVGIALVSGGACGNLTDRVLLGRVTDLLSFAFFDFPVFNVADMGIVTGVALLVGWLLFGPRTERDAPDPLDDAVAPVTGTDGAE